MYNNQASDFVLGDKVFDRIGCVWLCIKELVDCEACWKWVRVGVGFNDSSREDLIPMSEAVFTFGLSP
jgi:hypothetical protein